MAVGAGLWVSKPWYATEGSRWGDTEGSWDGFPRALKPLTSRFLGAKMELQIEVLHHVTQLIIIRIFPKLQGRRGSE